MERQVEDWLEKINKKWLSLKFQATIDLCNEALEKASYPEILIIKAKAELIIRKTLDCQSSLDRLKVMDLSTEISIKHRIIQSTVFRREEQFEKAISIGEELKAILNDKQKLQNNLKKELKAKIKLELGHLHFTKGRYKEAQIHFKQAKELLKDHKNSNTYYNLLISILSVYKVQGKFEEAIKIHNKIIKESEEYLEHPQYWQLCSNLFRAEIMTLLAQYDDSIEKLKICEQVLNNNWEKGEMSVTLSMTYLLFAFNYLDKYDNYESIFYAEKLILITENNKDQFYRIACNTLSKSYLQVGKIEKSKEYISKSYEFYKNQNGLKPSVPLVEIYRRMGEVYINEDPKLAKKYSLKAIKIIDALKLDKDNWQRLGPTINLWNVSSGEKKIQHAKKLVKMVSIGKDFQRAAYYYNCLGIAYLENDQLEEAIHNFETGLKISMIKDRNNKAISLRPNENWFAYFSIGKCYFQKYKSNSYTLNLWKAENYFNNAKELLVQVRREYQSERSKTLFNEQLLSFQKLFIELMLEREEVLSNDTLDEILSIIEFNKADTLKFQINDLAAKNVIANKEILHTENRIKKELIELENQLNDPSKHDTDLQNIFFDKKYEYKKLIKKLEFENPDYFEIKFSTQSISIEEIRAELNDDQIMINYFVFEDKLFILAIDQIEAILEEVRLDLDLKTLVDSYNKSITKLDKNTFQNISHQLYQILIQPISDLLFGFASPDSIRKLIVIPHSFLSMIPFESISRQLSNDRENPLDHLLNYFDITYHYSANLWLNKNKKVNRSPKFTFTGWAPVYSKAKPALQNQTPIKLDRSSHNNFDEVLNKQEYKEKFNSEYILEKESLRSKSDFPLEELPHSENEIREIAEIFELKEMKTKVFTHHEANKESLILNSHQSKILHLATHFIQNKNIPKLSGLALDNNEMFYIHESYGMNLSADLVVLSACESAIGQMFYSEGMIAINRGFLFSGAQNIISTLFKVSDKTSYELMVQFYQYYANGQSVSEALGNAKRKMLEKGDVPVKHWAAFVHIGC